MLGGQVINKRNRSAICLLVAILMISMIGVAVGSIAKGEERNLETVAYPTSFKLPQSDTTYSFSELTYIMKDKDKQHYFVMEPEYYYYHWAEINMTINYPEREDPLVYWDGKDEWDITRNYIHLYEDSSLTKEMKISGSEFVSLRYWFDDNNTVLSFSLGSILDLLDEHGGSQTYYIVIDPYLTATTEHEGTAVVIEFKYKDSEYTTTRKSHSTTSTTRNNQGYTIVYGDERDPVSQGIHINQPTIRRTYTTMTTTSTTKVIWSSTTSHMHDWVAIYDGDAIIENLSRFCQCPACGLRFGNRALLESHAYTFNHMLSDDPVEDVKSTGSNKEEVIVGYSGGIKEYVCKTCGVHSRDRGSESEVTPSSTTTTRKNASETLNGVVKGPDGKWAMYKNGKVDTSATGVFKNDYGWWRVEKGYVNFKANGIYQNQYGWWKTTNGKVTFAETGVFKNEYGWWRVEKSKVNFGANGLYSNQYGTWYVKKGKVDFSKNGVFSFNGKAYQIEKGKVVK